MTKCGYVSVVGSTKCRKSSLLNWFVGKKLQWFHISKCHKKRENIIVMHNDDQIVFVDTPGIHETENY